MKELPTITLIAEEELDLNDLLKQIVLSSDGAVAMFTGFVRGITYRDQPPETNHLEYETYQPMAEAMMKQIAGEIRARWNTIEGIAIVQRIGRLYPHTSTVFIACTSPHRHTGVFEAVNYGIDRLKQIVPVWKKEIRPSGEKWVEGDYLPTALETSHPLT